MAAPALVALAHGSRDPRSAATIKALVDEVRALRPDLRIETAFLDLSKPSLGHGRRQARPRKYEEIVVVPLLLTEAYHAKVDVPAAVAEADARHEQRPGPRHLDPRPRGLLPRGARRADARGAQGRPRPRARRARAGRRRLQRPARQPGGRPAGPALGHPPQAAGDRGVRLRRSPGHRRGGPRLPQGGPPPHRGRLAVPGARLPARPGQGARARGRCRRRRRAAAASTRPWPARSSPGTPSARSSWSRSSRPAAPAGARAGGPGRR